MADTVYITPKIERQLDQMAQQPNTPAVAAQRARQIIDSLIRGNAPVPGCAAEVDLEGADVSGTGRLRYRKDKRVKNSLKFNLGKGFRLICIKEKKELFVMFLGDHDSSDAWLDHFSKKRPHKADVTMAAFSVDNDNPLNPQASASREDPFYDPLPGEIPQEILRRVFSGLCAPG